MAYVASGRPVGRPRQFYKYELPSGVVKVVRAQCADYSRKELCIRDGVRRNSERIHSHERRHRQGSDRHRGGMPTAFS